MSIKQIHGQSVINTPKESHGYKLYPGTYGVIEWLQTTRKNPAITNQREVDLRDVAELCFSFTKPSDEVTAMTDKQLDTEVKSFMNSLLPDAFHALQSHAQTEILKFIQTKTTPKKKASKYPVMRTGRSKIKA